MLRLLKHHNFQCYSTRCYCLRNIYFWSQSSSKIFENRKLWKEKYCNNYLVWSGNAMFKDATMIDDDGLSLSAQSLKLYWRGRCKRLPCSNGEGEKVFHRRSKLQEGKTSYRKAGQLIGELKRTSFFVAKSCNLCDFYGFYTIPSSAIGWSWNKTWAKT